MRSFATLQRGVTPRETTEKRPCVSDIKTEHALVLLRHKAELPCWSSSAARTSWQTAGKGADQSSAHGCDRVWDVTLRPQGRILWVDDDGVMQAAGTAWWNVILRGESSRAGRSGIRRLRCTGWRDGESRAILGLRSGRARPPV